MVKHVKGVHQKGNLHVLALGEKPNPGYGLEIVKTEMILGQVRVYVKLTTPDPDMIYAAVITYPYLAGKAPANCTAVCFANAKTGEPL